MGVVSILLGLVLAGALADFLVENDVSTAATQSVTFAGQVVALSTPVLAAIAFGLGVLAVLLVFAGIRRLRRKRRRSMQDRITQLEDENARLVTQQNLPNVIRIPESAPVEAPQDSPATNWS